MSEPPRVLIELGAQFDRAAQRRLGPGARRRPRISWAAGLSGLSALVAIAIAVGAIALLSQPTQHSPGRAAGTHPDLRQGVGASSRIARRQAAIRARLIRQEERVRYRVARAILRNFAFFAPGARQGRFGRGASAFTVSQPAFSALPTIVLQLAAEGLPYDPRAAREVSTPSGLHVWIVPGRGICMLSPPDGGGACSGSLALAVQQGDLHRELARNGHGFDIGIVPNANATVTVKTAAGDTRSVPVIDNLFITPAAGLPAGPPNFHIKPGS